MYPKYLFVWRHAYLSQYAVAASSNEDRKWCSAHCALQTPMPLKIFANFKITASA
jgi:hypothetical protein